jgi:acetyl esterase
MSLENLEVKTRKFIEGLLAKKAPPIYTLSFEEARKVLDDAQKGPVKTPSVQVEEKILPCGPDQKISVSIIRPTGNDQKLPVIIFYHGGGWVLGNKNTHHRLVCELAVGVPATVIFVNYTPSPEAQFPKPLDESFAATQYIVQHADEFHVDASRLALVGDSVGGNMAIAMTFLAKEKGINIRSQVLFYPVTDANFNNGSYQQFAEGPWLTRAAMEWFWNAYAPHKDDRKKPLACPLQAPSDQLRNLPPALIITDENDVLRDEGEAYAHKLMQAEVPVQSVRFLGTCHDFVMLNALSETPAARGAIALAIDYLKKSLK